MYSEHSTEERADPFTSIPLQPSPYSKKHYISGSTRVLSKLFLKPEIFWMRAITRRFKIRTNQSVGSSFSVPTLGTHIKPEVNRLSQYLDHSKDIILINSATSPTQEFYKIPYHKLCITRWIHWVDGGGGGAEGLWGPVCRTTFTKTLGYCVCP